MEAIGHKLFQLGDPEGKGFIVRRDMQVSALLPFTYLFLLHASVSPSISYRYDLMYTRGHKLQTNTTPGHRVRSFSYKPIIIRDNNRVSPVYLYNYRTARRMHSETVLETPVMTLREYRIPRAEERNRSHTCRYLTGYQVHRNHLTPTAAIR